MNIERNQIRMTTNSLNYLLKQEEIMSRLEKAQEATGGAITYSDPRIKRCQEKLSRLGATKIPKTRPTTP